MYLGKPMKKRVDYVYARHYKTSSKNEAPCNNDRKDLGLELARYSHRVRIQNAELSATIFHRRTHSGRILHIFLIAFGEKVAWSSAR